MNTSMNSQHLDRMAWTIANRGFEHISPAALRELGFEARRVGVNTSVAHTLVDTTAPVVARQRAFGYIAAKLASTWHGFTNPTAEPATEACVAA